MMCLAHISDVHFGREDPGVVEGLLADVFASAPDAIVVSGDLTQRARKRQFRAAREFLDRLPDVPRIVVPGNHDVSATNLVERALRPLAGFRRYITPDLAPFLVKGDVAIVGINTVRTLKRKDGRISARQVREACAQLASAPNAAVRVVVTHHPMDLPADDLANAIVRRAAMAMKSFAEAGVDLFLSGHLHAGLTLATSARYRLPGYSAIVVHAGTAVSTRTRRVSNSWNLLRVDAASIAIEQRTWRETTFAAGATESYRRGEDGWVRSSS